MAASREPSLEETMALQGCVGALVWIHVSPPFVEVKMPPPLPTAASRRPEADEAMEDQFVVGAPDGVQFVPATPPGIEATKPGKPGMELVAGRNAAGLK